MEDKDCSIVMHNENGTNKHNCQLWNGRINKFNKTGTVDATLHTVNTKQTTWQLMRLELPSIHTSLPEHFRDHILPWTVSEVVHQFCWKGVATLPWGARDIRLYFNQHHYSSALGHFLLRTQHCRHVHSHWSGVFNLLTFDHTPKKGRKKERITNKTAQRKTDKVWVGEMSVDGDDDASSQHITEFVSCRSVVVGHEAEQVTDVTTQAGWTTTKVVVDQLTYHSLHNHHIRLPSTTSTDEEEDFA